MQVHLKAEFDGQTGDVTAKIRLGTAGWLDTAKVYERPLLILYTAYRLCSSFADSKAVRERPGG